MSGGYRDTVQREDISTLAAIKGLGVDADEAARLLALYCTGERAPRSEARPTDSDQHMLAPRHASAIGLRVLPSFDEIIAGEFTN